MTIIYHYSYRPMWGTCDRCGREDIPDDQLFLAVLMTDDEDVGSTWIGVCESCDDGDGSLRFHSRTLAELRAHTVFGSWEIDMVSTNPVWPARFLN